MDGEEEMRADALKKRPGTATGAATSPAADAPFAGRNAATTGSASGKPRAARGGHERMDRRIRGLLAGWLAWAGATLMVWAMKLLDNKEPHDGQ